MDRLTSLRIKCADLNIRLRVGALTAIAILLSAYTLQYTFGYQPCELCLQQRILWWSFLAVCSLAQLTRSRRAIYAAAVVGFAIMLVSLCLSSYHAGGERDWWSLKMFCQGLILTPNTTAEQLRELLIAKNTIACDKPALRLLGLSLAEYNAILSLAMLAFLAQGLLERVGGSSTSSRKR